MMILGEHSSVFRCQPEFAILTARQALFSLISWGNGSAEAKYEHNFYCHSTDSNHISLWKFILRVTSAEIPLRRLWLVSYKHNRQNCSFANKKPLKWQEHEQIEASTETASVGRDPLHDEMSLVPGRGLGSISDTWRGDEDLAGLSYNNSSLGPGTTELGSGMWAVLEGGVALRNPRHRDPLAMQWMQNCHHLMKFHSTLYLNRFE